MRLTRLSLAGMAGACALVASPAVRADQAPQSVFRGGTRTVAVYATVQDREGRLVPDLTKDDFQILDDGKPAPITTFSNEILPFTAVLLLDMSNSMATQYPLVRASGFEFIQAMLPADRIRIGTFGREVAVSPLLTSDKPTLVRVLTEEVWPGGATPLWRAAKVSMDSLVSQAGRRVILILTDGADSGGDYDCAALSRDAHGLIGPCPNRSAVKTQAQHDEFMYYAIGMEGPGLDTALIGIVDDTGGGHFELKRNADLEATFARVADELHHQYVLGFTPVALDGRTHTLQVRLMPAGMTARARKSYIASAGR